MNDLTVLADPVDAAERRASYIRTDLRTLIEHRDSIVVRIEEAKAAQDHVVLGYPSWTAYVAKEFGGLLAELDREDRQSVSAILSQTGMSIRGIAEVTGVSVGTVHSDLTSGVQSLNTCDSGQVRNDSAPDRTVTGLDGKEYAAERPERRKPRRRPLNLAIREANYDLQKAIGKLDRLTTDDRLGRMDGNDREKAKNEVARLQKVLFEIRQRLSGGAR